MGRRIIPNGRNDDRCIAPSVIAFTVLSLTVIALTVIALIVIAGLDPATHPLSLKHGLSVQAR